MWPFLTPGADGTHRGHRELGLGTHEQHTLVHGAEGAEGPRGSGDFQAGVGGWETLCWAEVQTHLWNWGQRQKSKFPDLPMHSPAFPGCSANSMHNRFV